MRRPDKRKQSLYFPEEMLAEIQAQADRLDRSMSWVVQCAWKGSRHMVANLPGHDLAQVASASPAKDPPAVGVAVEAKPDTQA